MAAAVAQQQQMQQQMQQQLTPGGVGVGGPNLAHPQHHAPPQAWSQSMELERRLKAESRKRGFWDIEIRRLRLSLQQTHESVIFANFEFAQVGLKGQ